MRIVDQVGGRVGAMIVGVLIVLAGGCASLTQVRFAVEPSGLDYIQLVQHRTMADGRLYTVKLELQGSGLLTYQAGTSARVRTGFWQPSDGASWNDLHSDRKVLAETVVRAALQRVVDAGAFDRGRDLNPDGLTQPILIQVRIGSEKRIFFTEEPAFLALFKDLLTLLVR
jgi:hypothetical protein